MNLLIDSNPTKVSQIRWSWKCYKMHYNNQQTINLVHKVADMCVLYRTHGFFINSDRLQDAYSNILSNIGTNA